MKRGRVETAAVKVTTIADLLPPNPPYCLSYAMRHNDKQTAFLGFIFIRFFKDQSQWDKIFTSLSLSGFSLSTNYCAIVNALWQKKLHPFSTFPLFVHPPLPFPDKGWGANEDQTDLKTASALQMTFRAGTPVEKVSEKYFYQLLPTFTYLPTFYMYTLAL